jgi:hypothetical protein
MVFSLVFKSALEWRHLRAGLNAKELLNNNKRGGYDDSERV